MSDDPCPVTGTQTVEETRRSALAAMCGGERRVEAVQTAGVLEQARFRRH